MTNPNKELIRQAAKDLLNSRYAIALTGAGVSTESGIPDFRGPDGVWTKNPEAEKQAYQTYEKFKRDPKAYWEERLTAPADPLEHWRRMEPNPGHYALAELEKMGFLKSTITQNIDGLHEKAGTKNLYEYHGGINHLRCISCNRRYPYNSFDFEAMLKNKQLPPRCTSCKGPLKSDVVFFGEPIPPDVAQISQEEAEKCDMMLICGTSAVVYPFAALPRIARYGATNPFFSFMDTGPQKAGIRIIEINAEPTELTMSGISDYIIQGKTGEILPQIVEAVKNNEE